MKIPHNQFIGLTIEDALKLYKPIRITIKDDKHCVITMDIKMNRMNVEIKNNKIVRIIDFG